MAETARTSPQIPLCRPFLSEKEELAAVEVLRSGWLMEGPKVADFEKLVAGYVGVKHAVAVNSGTSALTLALMAAGLGAGDGVVMPSHSFVATANSALLAGCGPVFVDIGQRNYNMDPSKIPSAIGPGSRAIMAVHQFGFPADMGPIQTIASEHGLIIIEDAACSLGSTYHSRQTGGFGTLACFSFHPRKLITTGEGGMVVTDSEEMARTMRSLRNHGLATRGERERSGYQEAGYNYRMSDIQAGIGIEQFRKLDEIIGLRTRLAGRYMEAISKLPALKLPAQVEHSRPNYQSFIVEVADESVSREAVLAWMNERGIQCTPGIQPIHLEPAYAGNHSAAVLPETLRAARRSFLLPLYPSMTDEDQDFVIDSLGKALDRRATAGEMR